MTFDYPVLSRAIKFLRGHWYMHIKLSFSVSLPGGSRDDEMKALIPCPFSQSRVPCGTARYEMDKKIIKARADTRISRAAYVTTKERNTGNGCLSKRAVPVRLDILRETAQTGDTRVPRLTGSIFDRRRQPVLGRRVPKPVSISNIRKATQKDTLLSGIGCIRLVPIFINIYRIHYRGNFRGGPCEVTSYRRGGDREEKESARVRKVN
ncbi:hypothetical protein PUN28_000609 [Cardiocondyla obscurior]|uniref:Uncharacterized protein n=1 Tax=Cardiocondyla obscurior TaxID=286306 RepID=A0AAW2H0C5_9HYME